jgi:cell wall-associated NlpC family hydrolase
LRVRTLRATLCSLTFPIAIAASFAGSIAGAAAPAFGADTLSGGTSAGSVAHTTVVSPATAGGSTPVGGAPAGAPAPSAPTHAPAVHAPVTAHTSSIAYKGPVYERAVTGTVVPYVVPPPAGTTNGSTGGSAAAVVANAKPELLVPGAMARYVDGLAAAPMSAPPAVQEIVWAANQIIGLPYIFGGGHGSFSSPGYDCSGTVSFALHGASLLKAPMDSSEFMGWGGHGIGRWVTVFTNPEHAYMTVAGLRLDTSAADDPSNQQGPRWRPLRPGNWGFRVRHPAGL